MPTDDDMLLKILGAKLYKRVYKAIHSIDDSKLAYEMSKLSKEQVIGIALYLARDLKTIRRNLSFVDKWGEDLLSECLNSKRSNVKSFKEWMDINKMTCRQAADLFKTSRTTISKIINGEIVSTPDLLIRISSITGLPISSIIGGGNE